MVSKYLPREHGASVIWLSSMILLISLSELTNPFQIILTIVFSLAVLEFIALISRRSYSIILAEKNPLFLILLSGSVTLIVPIGFYLITNHFLIKTAVTWLLLFTYTTLNVFLSQRSVQNILFNEKKSISLVVLGGTLLLATENLFYALSGLMPSLIFVSMTPFLLTLFLSKKIERISSDGSVPKTALIRKVGLLQSANLISFSIIVSIILIWIM
jgi:hypothetical protein